MSKVFIEESTLTAIGNAIRGKTGGTDLIAPLNMPTEINGISTGGGTLPPEALNITGDCRNLFKDGKWNWFINNYGSQVTTNNILQCSGMFLNNFELTHIPFPINCTTDAIDYSSMFNSAKSLLALPAITGTPNKMDDMFKNAEKIKEIPESYATTLNLSYINRYTSGSLQYLFFGCYSLRTIPSNFLKQCYSADTSSYSSPYYYGFCYCFSLDEIVGLPIISVTQNYNNFNITFGSGNRAKNIIFDTNEDGTAKTARWMRQTADFTKCGYINTADKEKILNYNSGITADKEVTDDATYAALKNDPDWFTCNVAYSRYNKTSAIATINSLPDTSAYIAANGGTNTIKFFGNAGSATDGGAINTMTEEQIAVATAKGWSVAFV